MKSRVCGRCGAIVSGVCGCKRPQVSTAAKGYGRKWQKFRERLFRIRAKVGVTCAMCCKAFGAESPHADHIIPVLSAEDPLFYDPNNIQFLHPDCHGRKTDGDVKAGATR
jgi:5-methylcytosine-specific restriction endonuclease McrA